jgi:hypothetical protein
MTHSPQYTAYIHSPEWRSLCREIYAERGHVCEMCGRTDTATDMHHKTYDRLGHELKSDLMIVCHDVCHPRADRERVEREARRIAQRGMKWATLEDVHALTMRLIANGQ